MRTNKPGIAGNQNFFHCFYFVYVLLFDRVYIICERKVQRQANIIFYNLLSLPSKIPFTSYTTPFSFLSASISRSKNSLCATPRTMASYCCFFVFLFFCSSGCLFFCSSVIVEPLTLASDRSAQQSMPYSCFTSAGLAHGS